MDCYRGEAELCHPNQALNVLSAPCVEPAKTDTIQHEDSRILYISYANAPVRPPQPCGVEICVWSSIKLAEAHSFGSQVWDMRVSIQTMFSVCVPQFHQ